MFLYVEYRGWVWALYHVSRAQQLTFITGNLSQAHSAAGTLTPDLHVGDGEETFLLFSLQSFQLSKETG